MFNITGAAGAPGIGGKGGCGTSNGKTVKHSGLFLFFGTLNVGETSEPGAKIENAEDGQDGQNDHPIDQYSDPIDQFVKQSQTINAYKHYAREHLANHFRMSELSEFLQNLEKIEQKQALYEPMGFAIDLLQMEHQYFQLRDKLSFVPFVKSLVSRIHEYLCTHQKHMSNDDKKLLNFVYTAALSKLCSVQNHTRHIPTADLLKYLELMQNQIEKLNKVEETINVNEHRARIQRSLEVKINLAKDLITVQIMPEIVKIFDEIGKQIAKLIKEIMKDGKANVEHQLKEAMLKHKIMFWLNVICTSLSFIAVAAIVGMNFHGIGVVGKNFYFF